MAIAHPEKFEAIVCPLFGHCMQPGGLASKDPGVPFMNWFEQVWTDERGQDTAEYALLLLLIALALIAAISGFRSAIANAFSRGTAQLNAQ